MNHLRVVGIDPGFANIGLVAVDLYAMGGCDMVDTRLVTTAPSKKKIAQRVDEKRRLEEIEDAFLSFIEGKNIEVMAMEEPGKCLMKRQGKWVTNPATLRTSCLMWGAVHGICRSQGIYCIEVGSQDIKKVVCGKKNASKAEVIEAVKNEFPAYKDWPTSKKIEHVTDAAGAVLASMRDPVVMTMLRKLRTAAS